MGFNLLSQNLLLVVCVALTVLMVYLITKLLEPQVKSKKLSQKQKTLRLLTIKQLLTTLVISVFVSLGIKIFIAHATGSGLPGAFVLMALPTIFNTGLLVLIVFKKRNLQIAGVACLVFGVLFSLLIVNNYYRFFPTLGQVFDKNAVASNLDSSQKYINLQFTPTLHRQLDMQSVEGSLTSLNKQPTKGKVYSLNIPGDVSKFHARKAYVYVPAVYNNPAGINLPVIILSAGFPGLPENWLGSGLQTTMDEFASHHDGITPLVFMVDNSGSLTNDTECVDSPRGNVETYLSVDVPNFVKSNFQIATGPSHWAIGGLSMGGMCSIMLALRHPDVYNYFLDYGGELGPEVGSQSTTIRNLFRGSVASWQSHQPVSLLATHTYKNMGGFFGVGSQDERVITDAAIQLSSASKKAGIETIYEVIGGQHTFSVWQGAFKLSLPWVSNRLGATQCGVTCL